MKTEKSCSSRQSSEGRARIAEPRRRHEARFSAAPGRERDSRPIPWHSSLADSIRRVRDSFHEASRLSAPQSAAQTPTPQSVSASRPQSRSPLSRGATPRSMACPAVHDAMAIISIDNSQISREHPSHGIGPRCSGEAGSWRTPKPLTAPVWASIAPTHTPIQRLRSESERNVADAAQQEAEKYAVAKARLTASCPVRCHQRSDKRADSASAHQQSSCQRAPRAPARIASRHGGKTRCPSTGNRTHAVPKMPMPPFRETMASNFRSREM